MKNYNALGKSFPSSCEVSTNIIPMIYNYTIKLLYIILTFM